MSTPELTLPAVLGALEAAGQTFDLDRSMSRPVLTFDPPLSPEAADLLDPWRPWLTYVALGRYTRHAPVACDRCGFLALGRAIDGAAGWRAAGTCPLCSGHRSVIGTPTLHRRRPRRRAAS